MLGRTSRDLSKPGGRAMQVPSQATSPSDRRFFALAGLWFVILTFVGFGPSFYFRIFPEPLPAHQIVHGVLYTAWVLLFLTQTLLISGKRIRWHMALGASSVLLLILMLPVGFHVVLVKSAAGLKSVDEAGFNLTELTLAFALAAAGLVQRKRPAVHKRLMLFATLMFTVAAADRVSIVLGLEQVRIFRKLLAVAPALALIGYDSLRQRGLLPLSLSLLAVVWAVIWFYVSDLVFLRPIGEAIITWLTRVFVW